MNDVHNNLVLIDSVQTEIQTWHRIFSDLLSDSRMSLPVSRHCGMTSASRPASVIQFWGKVLNGKELMNEYSFYGTLFLGTECPKMVPIL